MTLRQVMSMSKPAGEQTYTRAEWTKLLELLHSFRDGEMNRPNLMLVRLGGQGDVTKTHVDWQDQDGVPEVPSPLVYRDRIYLIRNGGLLACRNLADGKVIYDERIGAPGGYFASPLAAEGHIYLASDRGTVTVVQAGDKLDVLARNDLGESIFASPAAVDFALYVRTSQHLWAFGR
jgi:hypothetical protein